MVTYTVNVGINKLAVAEEAISSVARILSAAGFDLSEVANLLRGAADQIDSGEAISNNYDDERAEYDQDDEDSYSILERYEETPEIKSLKRLSKRASALDNRDDAEQREKSHAILEQALPLAKKALDWLIAECAAKGIATQPNREEWLSSADDDELDLEDNILFLDDWRVNGDFQFQLIQDLVRHSARQGDQASFNKIVELMSQNPLFYDSRTMEEVTKSGEALKSVHSFATFLARYAGTGEQMQSTLFDEFIHETGFSGGTYMLDGWLESLAETGHIQKYKRSNRWRVTVG